MWLEMSLFFALIHCSKFEGKIKTFSLYLCMYVSNYLVPSIFLFIYSSISPYVCISVYLFVSPCLPPFPSLTNSLRLSLLSFSLFLLVPSFPLSLSPLYFPSSLDYFSVSLYLLINFTDIIHFMHNIAL